MVVLTLSKCPAGLKGDITKWLFEVNTGVYVGRISARVRERLWERVCEYCGSGEATMVFPAKNEQGFSFYVYNTRWRPVDLDGIFLIKKPLPIKSEITTCQKKREKRGKEDKIQKPIKTETQMQAGPIDVTSSIIQGTIQAPDTFVAIDLETTGLKSNTDSIIELAAVRYKKGVCVDKFHALIKYERDIPEIIVGLTGINNALLDEKGMPLEKALHGMMDFIGDDIIIGHYISFDMKFIRKACERFNIVLNEFRVIDTIALTKEVGPTMVDNYKLETLVKKYGIAERQEHRALPDAILVAELFLKLNEKK